MNFSNEFAAVIISASGIVGLLVGVTIGLASIIVGTTFIKKEKIIFQLVAVVFGAIFYRAVLTVALQLGLPSGYLKLLSAVLVIVAIASTNGAFRSKKRGRN